jgi:hypothetical protein
MRPQNPEDLLRQEHELFLRTEINGIEDAVAGSAKHEKVNKICDSLKDQLVGLNQENKYLLPILTTYIKKQP